MITSPQLVTSGTNPTITINFGGRVAQLNPLLLYNITGAGRTDVVYDVNNGIVLVTAYVDENQATDILYVSCLCHLVVLVLDDSNANASQQGASMACVCLLSLLCMCTDILLTGLLLGLSGKCSWSM